MFRDLAYLWRHRERPGTLGRWLVVWAKRALLFLPLCRLLARSCIFRLNGATIGRLVILGRSRITGRRARLEVGDGTTLGRCEILLHDGVTLGRCVVVNDGAVLLTASHSLDDPKWHMKTGPIVIGDHAWIATNAIVLPNVRIGRGAVVAAGAVVRGDVPDFGLAVGNPAKIESNRRSPEFCYNPALLTAPIEAWVGHAPNGRADER